MKNSLFLPSKVQNPTPETQIRVAGQDRQIGVHYVRFSCTKCSFNEAEKAIENFVFELHHDEKEL